MRPSQLLRQSSTSLLTAAREPGVGRVRVDEEEVVGRGDGRRRRRRARGLGDRRALELLDPDGAPRDPFEKLPVALVRDGGDAQPLVAPLDDEPLLFERALVLVTRVALRQPRRSSADRSAEELDEELAAPYVPVHGLPESFGVVAWVPEIGR